MRIRNQHQAPAKAPQKNALHFVAAFLVLAAFVFGVVQAVHSSLFNLNDIVVQPLSEAYPITEAQILALARVPMTRVNLFDLNLEPITARLIKHPWIKGVVLGKQFPHSLSIKVIERVPVALLTEEKGKVLYLEGDGASFEDQAMTYVKDLPIIEGFMANDIVHLKQVNAFIAAWFDAGKIPGLRLSSVSYNDKLGLRAVVLYPMKNNQQMRSVLELGLNIEEATQIPQGRLHQVLKYLAERSMQASKIWLGDGKKIVVKISRGS